MSAKRTAKIVLATDPSGVAPGLNDARRQLRAFEREQARSAKQQARDKAKEEKDNHSQRVGLLRQFAGGAAAVAGFDLGGGLVGAATGVIDFERNLTRFQIAAKKTPQQMDELRSAIARTSSDFGMNREEVLAGARAYVDLAGAEAFSESKMRTIAKTVRATGADVNDVSTVMYSLGDAMHIDDSQMEATLSGLINQSKDGAVHFNQLAAEIIGIAPRFARFGVTGRQGANELGAMFQVMRSGFKDSSETATGMEGVFRGLGLHAKNFEKFGVSIFKVGKDGSKTFRPIREIFDDIAKNPVLMNPDSLQKAFGRGEGEQAFRILIERMGKFRELMASGLDTGTLDRDLNTYLTSSSGKLEVAINNIKLAIASAFTPERIAAFADGVAALVSQLGNLGSAIGAVWDATGLGGVHEIGKSIRDKLGGNEVGNVSLQDAQLAQGGRGSWAASSMLMNGMSEEEVDHRIAAARRNVKGAQRYSDTADRILGAETDEKVTPASIREALNAKYAGEATNSADRQERLAGAKYLRAAGAKDPIEESNRLLLQIAEQLKNLPRAPVEIDGGKAGKILDNNPRHRGH